LPGLAVGVDADISGVVLAKSVVLDFAALRVSCRDRLSHC
jgi:hypothetical protein